MTEIGALRNLVQSLLEGFIILLILVLGVLNLYWQDFVIGGTLLIIGLVGVVILVYNIG